MLWKNNAVVLGGASAQYLRCLLSSVSFNFLHKGSLTNMHITELHTWRQSNHSSWWIAFCVGLDEPEVDLLGTDSTACVMGGEETSNNRCRNEGKWVICNVAVDLVVTVLPDADWMKGQPTNDRLMMWGKVVHRDCGLASTVWCVAHIRPERSKRSQRWDGQAHLSWIN